MIHDTVVPVSCDHPGCTEQIYIECSYVGGGICHGDIAADDSDEAIEEKLPRRGWTVRDGAHFCENHGRQASGAK